MTKKNAAKDVEKDHFVFVPFEKATQVHIYVCVCLCVRVRLCACVRAAFRPLLACTCPNGKAACSEVNHHSQPPTPSLPPSPPSLPGVDRHLSAGQREDQRLSWASFHVSNQPALPWPRGCCDAIISAFCVMHCPGEFIL